MTNLTETIQELLDESNGNWDEAIDKLSDMLETDTEMFDTYVRPMIRDFARSKVQALGHARRANLFHGAGKERRERKGKEEKATQQEKPTPQVKGVSGEENHKGKMGDIAVLHDNIQRYLDDYWLNNCKKILGDATYEDLTVEIDESLRHAKGNYERAHWYREVRDGLNGKSKVREAFNSDDLENLIVKVQKDIEEFWGEEEKTVAN